MEKTTVIQVLKAINRIVTLRLPAALNQIPPYAPFLPEEIWQHCSHKKHTAYLAMTYLPVCTSPLTLCRAILVTCKQHSTVCQLKSFFYEILLCSLCVSLFTFVQNLILQHHSLFRWKETTCLFSNHSKINMPSSDPKAIPFVNSDLILFVKWLIVKITK